MSRCPEARELLPGYVEGELSAAERTRVAGHLELCAACRREEAQYRAAIGLLHAPVRREAPGDLYAGFAAKLARHEKPAPRQQFGLRWAVAMACLLLVVGAGAAYMRAQRNQAAPGPVVVEHPKTQPIEPVTPKIEPTAPTGGGSSVPTHIATRPKVDPFEQPKTNDTVTPDSPADSSSDNEPKAAIRPPRKPFTHERVHYTPDDLEAFRHVSPKQGLSVAERRQRERQREEEWEAMVSPPTDSVSVPTSVPLDERAAPKIDATADSRSDSHEGSGLARTPGVAVVVPMRDERVKIGDSITRVRTAAGFDSKGRRVLVKVSIGTTGD